MSFVLLLTPTGSLPSPRWRWLAVLLVATPVVAGLRDVFGSDALLAPPAPPVRSPLAVPALAGPLELIGSIASAVIPLAALAAAGSLVVRFHRAGGLERQQLRWVAYAAALLPVAALVAIVANRLEYRGVAAWGIGMAILGVHLAIFAAVVRYRLYDLDRIVSRTLAWGLLSVLLGVGYAVVVLGLGRLLPQDSSLVVAGATLAVAGVFRPARRRVQAAVDRRFNRRRYDAERTIAAFSDHLREQVDLDTLTVELLAVVEQTMQPTQASLWLRPQGQSSATGRTVTHQLAR